MVVKSKCLSVIMGHICGDQKYEDIKERYKNLYDDWKDSVGLWQSVQMIMCELNCLGTVADQLCRNGAVVIKKILTL